MDSSGGSFAEAVAVVRRAYLDGLGARAAALEAAIAGLPVDPTARDVIRKHAHALRGSGATFGFPAVSDAARRVERAEDPAGLPDLVAGLVAAIRAAVAAPGPPP